MTTNRKEIIYLPMSYLHPNPANPESRMQDAHIKQLLLSVRKNGLQYPILVAKRTDDYFEIIDGHRRFACYISDKHDEIPCIVADGNSNELYSIVNGTARPLKGVDWALVFVHGGTVPKGITLNNLNALSQLIGNEGILELVDLGISPGVYQTARRVTKYVYGDSAISDTDLLGKIVLWLARKKQTSNCLNRINTSGDPAPMKEAIENDSIVRITK